MLLRSCRWVQSEQGFSLLSILMGLTILTLALVGLIPLFTLTTDVSASSRAKLIASNLGNRELEKIRAVPYDDVGVISGNPDGILNADYDEEKDDISFHIKTRVKWVDGDFDGVFPSDSDPRDYKQVTITVSWQGVFTSGNEVEMITYVSRESEEKVVTGGNILATAKDTENNPLQNVRIDISTGPSSPIWDETDIDGEVLFPMLDPSVEEGDYTVAATKTGWVCRPDTANQTTTVIVNETRNLEFILGQSGGLVVHLLDPLGNLVGMNSRITLNSAESGTQEFSSHDGNFTVSELFPGFYDLTAWAASYESTAEPISIEILAGDTLEINVTLQPKPSGRLHLNVYDTASNPIGPADVTITNDDSDESIETQTNDSGILEIQLEEGYYTVEVSMETYQTQTHSLAIDAPQNTFLDVYLNEANQYGSILVRCERQRNGEPRDYVRIRVIGNGYDMEQQTGSYASGEALFDNLVPGNYTVYRWRWGWRYARQLTVVAGQQERVLYRW